MKPKPDLFSDGLKRLQIDSIFDNPSLSCYTPINLTFKNFYQIEEAFDEICDYSRVSNRKQSIEGNRLDEQIENLQAVGYNELIDTTF